MFSKLVAGLSWFAVVFATFATALWVWEVFFVEYNFLFDFVFTLVTAPVNIGVLAFVVIPSNKLYFRTKERRYLISLVLSGCSFVVVLVETVLVWTVIQLHGA